LFTFLSLTVPISSSKELSSLYIRSCEKHNTAPITSIIENLEAINLDSPATTVRTEVLNLRHETLSHESCEALEELFKRVKYKAIDLTSCSLDDVSATTIFDMIEYYEACNELNISENSNIKNRGWQSCKFGEGFLSSEMITQSIFQAST
jgi:protein phosphatase 1 regulatory subunit 37